ncbi:unnamed protein product [Hermetia illucens]|uniref:alpha-glucosidase n=2 Tax=Hermetia illucens TaxID=343691 RepID=A0A7R8YXV5_HERIL|nr:unnamed protein product [Hermetia illucens]
MKLLILVLALWVPTIFSQSDWWQTGQFYQIYPRSFKDSNGDGIGDLNGIREKLPHLKDIGMTAAWLSPIYKSPMKDFGYDIADFKAIQPEYGTMADFDALLKRAKELGIKLIMDLVPNHTSDLHEWFQKSVNRVKGYEDFYVWHDGYPDPKNSSNRLPPSNWLSNFRGSAWKWNAKRQQFYLHQYLAEQPDLNYRNPLVIEAMEDVLNFWLDKGVAGFRVDSVPTVFEVQADSKGKYPDEPKSGFTDDPENSAYLKHIYTQDQPETTELVYRTRAFLDEYQRKHGGDTRIILTEIYSPIDIIMQYYGNGTYNGAHIPFNFNFITKVNKDSKAPDYAAVISLWMDNMPKRYTANWVIGNHDNRRAGSRYGPERIDAMNMLLMVLPGASVTYNGEEIGMLDVDISWNDTVDPAACNSNPQIYQQFTRDPARTPFQWDDSKNAGFSTGNKTWLPIHSNYKQVNVKVEQAAARSHLKVFKDLIQLRQTSKTLQRGELKYKALNDNVLAVQRSLSGSNTILLLMNVSDKSQTVYVQQWSATIPSSMKVRIASVQSKRNANETLKVSSITLDPYESLVLE